MPRFINVATKEKQAVLLNADNLSVVVDLYPNKGYGKDGEGVLVVYPQSKYEPQHISRKELGLEVGACGQKLIQGGAELFQFPYVWGDRKEIGQLFVNPEAFTYLITSKAVTPEGKTEPHVALLMGLEGYGRLESYEVPVSAVEKFLDIVKQRRPQLARVNPDEARARFYEPGYVVYDPLKVIRVYQNGDGVNVRFTSPEDVDFNFELEVAGQYLNAKYGPDSPHGNKQDSVNQSAINKAYAFEHKLRFRLQREFARKVAKDAPDLVRIEGAESILYTRFTNATRLEIFTPDRPDQKTKLFVFYQKDTPDSSGFSSHGQAHFKTPAAAVKEVERLQALLLER